MKKNYIVILLFLFFINSACSMTLSGGVEYTLEKARTEAFSGIRYKIDVTIYSAYFQDTNFHENKKSLSRQKEKVGDRYIAKFSDGDYVVTYKSDINTEYYYSDLGKLKYIGITYSKNYPMLGATYDINGNLESTTLSISKDNDYIFDLNKKLVAHWIGKNGYNEKGELFGTRD